MLLQGLSQASRGNLTNFSLKATVTFYERLVSFPPDSLSSQQSKGIVLYENGSIRLQVPESEGD